MYVSFSASESVHISVTNQATPIQHYLRQPQRLVGAIADPQLIKQVSDDLYELKMRPINFMEIYHFQPIVLLKVWSGSQGIVYLKSEDCNIKGVNYINDRFSLKLKGILYPQQLNGATILKGQADLEVAVGLPTALMFTPKPFLERTGSKLLRGVLSRMKHKLSSQLVHDYYTWASQSTELESKSATKLLPNLDLGC